MSFDHQAGVRERLALLAELGPHFNPNDYGYHPTRDVWYFCGNYKDAPPWRNLWVSEASASLERIKTRWNMDRQTALALVGFPDTSIAAQGEQ